MELQGDSPQAVEAYETALSTLDTAGDLTKLWIRSVKGAKGKRDGYQKLRSILALIQARERFCRYMYDVIVDVSHGIVAVLKNN